MFVKIKKSAIGKYANILRAYPNLFEVFADGRKTYTISPGMFEIDKKDCVVIKEFTPENVKEIFERR